MVTTTLMANNKTMLESGVGLDYTVTFKFGCNRRTNWDALNVPPPRWDGLDFTVMVGFRVTVVHCRKFVSRGSTIIKIIIT